MRRLVVPPAFLRLASAPLFTTAVKSSLQRIVTEIGAGRATAGANLSPRLGLEGETILGVDRTFEGAMIKAKSASENLSRYPC